MMDLPTVHGILAEQLMGERQNACRWEANGILAQRPYSRQRTVAGTLAPGKSGQRSVSAGIICGKVAAMTFSAAKVLVTMEQFCC
jgi:hypothetical protein